MAWRIGIAGIRQGLAENAIRPGFPRTCPAFRRRARLSEDVIDGYVTPAAARRDHGFAPG